MRPIFEFKALRRRASIVVGRRRGVVTVVAARAATFPAKIKIQNLAADAAKF